MREKARTKKREKEKGVFVEINFNGFFIDQ